MSQGMTDRPDLTSYYNGACPVCGVEMRHYRRLADKAGLDLKFDDLTATDTESGALGIDRDTLFRRLHVKTKDGRVLAGVDAFLPLWAALPGYRWLYRLVSLPVVKPVADLVYDRVLAPLIYRWHLRRQRKGA